MCANRPPRKLNPAQRDEVVEVYRRGWLTRLQIAKEYRVSLGYISQIIEEAEIPPQREPWLSNWLERQKKIEREQCAVLTAYRVLLDHPTKLHKARWVLTRAKVENVDRWIKHIQKCVKKNLKPKRKDRNGTDAHAEGDRERVGSIRTYSLRQCFAGWRAS